MQSLEVDIKIEMLVFILIIALADGEYVQHIGYMYV